jgi:class 3 adenylate cyclase/predicted ATPase
MDFYTVLTEVENLLRSRGRVSYRALKIHFDLDDQRLDALRTELLYAHPGTVSEDGEGLAWTTGSASTSGQGAERRQLTVMFCDLVDSTPLASQFDPEEWREVMGAYYDTCGKVIARFDGHIANYLGDGLLVYFGYPRAHEDDAQRAVRAGLGIIEAVGQLNAVVSEEHGVSLAVRLGCHTGLVVVGEAVSGTGHDDMVLGETPNIAARLQGVAEPNTLVIGALTHQLLGGFFACESLGNPPLKGVATPIEVYRVLYESTARTRLEALASTGLTPLVGRATEMRLLEETWGRVIDGSGQVVVISGEAGIGKSRLVRALTEHAAQHQAWFTLCQCSPYYQHTAFYPVIDLLERIVLRFKPQDSPAQKLANLEGFLVQSGLPLAETIPLFANLLSIPLSAEYASPDTTPEQQKHQTMRALITVPLHRAEQQPVMFVAEDLHWVDPTTLDWLNMLVDEIHTARILAVFTARPDFRPPWRGRSNVTFLDTGRLPSEDVAELTHQVAQGKTLPAEVVAEVVSKTDGVPLFVEELTKMLLDSGMLEERADRYELTQPLPPLAVPNTLQDSLMARLDRLAAVKALAQLGATLGREFSYRLIQAVSPWRDDILREGLEQLVAAEFLYQRGVPPQATYRFKHALTQEAAYQSLLKSTRQLHHQRIAATLESRFPETVETRPELLAHHYTQAGLTAQAIPYWQAAGQRAVQRHANSEAANHATRALELLSTLPDTPQRAKQELSLQILLGVSAGAVHGPQAGESSHARALELARRVGSTPELFPALSGYAYGQMVHGHMSRARALGEEFLQLAQPHHDPLVLAVGHRMLAYTAWWAGDFIDARNHSGQGLAFYTPEQHRACVASYTQDSGIVCGYVGALADWVLGYPTQALQAMERTVAYARELAHPYAVAITLLMSAQLSQLRREPEVARKDAEEALELSAEHGLDATALWCLLPRGWAIAQQGDVSAGISEIREGMKRRQSVGIGAVWPWWFALLADAYGADGQVVAGLEALEEALQWVQRNDERLYEAEVHRLKGELLLRQNVPDTAQAESCFQHALTVARNQQAKSWELRAAVSLGRLYQLQDRREDAYKLLAPVYAWFTEGFDTADLQDAKALLEELS